MKKGLFLLLSAVILLAVCSTLAYTADNADAVVFFFKDFESDEIGKTATKANGYLNFDNSAVTDLALVEVVDEGGNKVIKYHLAPGKESGGPRVDKELNVRELKQFTIEYDFMTSGGKSTSSVVLREKGTGETLTSTMSDSIYTKWTHIRIDVDLEKLTAVAYADGVKAKTTSIKPFQDETLVVRFGSSMISDGGWFMLDNIRIYTEQNDYKSLTYLNTDTITTPYNAADAAPDSGDLVVIIDEDFETQTEGEMVKMRPGGFETSALKAAAPMTVLKENGSKFGHFYHGAPETEPTVRGQYVGKSFPLAGLNTLVVDYDIKSSKLGKSTFSMVIYNPDTSKTAVSVPVPTNFEDWTHTKVRFDFVEKTAKVYIAGKFYKEYKADVSALTTAGFRMSCQIHPDGSGFMIDNVKLSTPDKDAGGIFNLTGEFFPEKVKIDASERIGMTDVMRQSHPRIMLTDWQQVRAKIDTDENYKIWKDNLIASANRILETMPVAYSVNARNNINECSTKAKSNMITLAGAYGITGDGRYKYRLYNEIVNVGNWPNWDGKTYLCTAHLILGTSIAYDWLYNDWTPEERENIKNILLQKGVSQAVLGYEGQLAGTGNWINSASNWNNVCNGANVIAAIALADLYPELAEYIFVKADAALQKSFTEISPDGAYAETVGYWDYGVRYQVKMMAALESSLKDGAILPERLDYTDNIGLDKTGDFPIYYNGTTAAFNYGDGTSDIKTTPILYWFATKYDNPRYAWYNLYMINNYDSIEHPSNHNAIFSILWYDAEHTKGADTSAALDKFYASTESKGANGISMRSSWVDSDALVVMAHAGDASSGHTNHDAGGFVLDWAGKRWVHMYGREPGGQSAGSLYAWPGYFDLNSATNGRYQYYHTRGEANNTIIANPKQGMADMQVKYYATLLRSDAADNKAFGIIDMTQTNKSYVDAKRGFMLTDMRETLVIQDEIKADAPSEFYWFANTLANVTLAADGKSALLEMDGDYMLVRITQGPADAKIGVMPTSPLPTSPNPTVQKKIEEEKLFIHIENVQELNLTVEFVPLKDGEGIPAPQPVEKLDQWSVADSPAFTASQQLGDMIVLKVDNPNVYIKGAKSFVEEKNTNLTPVLENGCVFVPVRFFVEKFNAEVVWKASTNTLTIETAMNFIRLQLGANQMIVDGKQVTLDTPAKDIDGRIMLPLMPLAEVFGKQVSLDSRGLVIISDGPVTYDEATMSRIGELLGVRVQVNGKDIAFFDSDIYTYYIAVSGDAQPILSAIANVPVSIEQGTPATLTLGDKTYTFHFTKSPAESISPAP